MYHQKVFIIIIATLLLLSLLLVNLCTTGNGTVRFNPNLYNDGKVCLSLLGTWSGPSWNPKSSTLLQVLVSIQSLILVNDPFFNEPGFQNMEGTSNGQAKSMAYNKTIQTANLTFAMINTLKFPSPIFADIIHEHFRLKATDIIDTVTSWSHHNHNVKIQVPELRQLLLNLNVNTDIKEENQITMNKRKRYDNNYNDDNSNNNDRSNLKSIKIHNNDNDIIDLTE